MVQGYHVYKDVWDATISEELSCQREADNYTDPFADAIVKEGNTVEKLCKTCYNPQEHLFEKLSYELIFMRL